MAMTFCTSERLINNGRTAITESQEADRQTGPPNNGYAVDRSTIIGCHGTGSAKD